MTEHARTQIRQVIAGILKQETDPSGWALVWQSRFDYERAVWPYLKVYCPEETSVRSTVTRPPLFERTMTVHVVAMIRMATGEREAVENKMDTIAALIEQNLTDEALQLVLPNVKTIDLTATQSDVVLNTDDTISHAELTTVWQVKYWAQSGVPDTLI